MSIINVYINICLELPALILSIFLYVVCHIRKKHTGTIKGLNGIIAANIGLLMTQIMEWISVSWAINNSITPVKLFFRWFFYISEYWFGVLLAYEVLFYAISTVEQLSGKKKNYDYLLKTVLIFGGGNF